jgi:signal transduction histidine kinase
MRWPFKLVAGILVAYLCLLPGTCPAARAQGSNSQAGNKQANQAKHVLLLHSFGRDFKPWSEYARSIRTELDRQSPWPLDVSDHSLVTARSSDEDPEKPFVEYLRALYAKRPLDLIVSIGAPAAAFVQRNRAQLFMGTPMVFTAVDQRRVQFSTLTANDAAVPVRIDYLAAFENILRVLPGTRNVTVVVGTSPIEKFWKDAIAREVEPVAGRVALSWTDQLSFEQLLRHAANLPPDTAIFWELMIVDAAGVVHEGDTALARLYAAAKAPIFSYDESFYGSGMVGGPFLRVADTARQTAAVAVRILGGEKAGDIRIPPVEFARPAFDFREMQRWVIPESRLPPGSEIHFRELTAWQKYRVQILLVAMALALQGVLITWLLFEHWRRQTAEADSMQRMNDIARLNRVATAGELSASIAHEIRQPLATIASSGSAGLNWLQHKVPDIEEAKHALEAVVKASHRADDVLKGVRAMFRSEPTAREKVDVSELVRQVLLLVERPRRAGDIALTTLLANDPAATVMADPVQLQQAILNLVMNAIEAMDASSLPDKTLRVETAVDPSGEVVLTVQDSGPGFDDKAGENLFKPFVTTKPGGMGMGLSICKSIVEQHHGRVTAARVHPHGAKFQIILPRAD